MVSIRGVPGNFAGPQGNSHYRVRIADHQQGEEVNQNRHANVVPAIKWMGGVSQEIMADQGLTATFLSIFH